MVGGGGGGGVKWPPFLKILPSLIHPGQRLKLRFMAFWLRIKLCRARLVLSNSVLPDVGFNSHPHLTGHVVEVCTCSVGVSIIKVVVYPSGL